MTFIVVYLLFPLVLAIHNVDEYSRHGDFVRIYHSRLAAKLTSSSAIKLALIWLTLAAAVLSVLTYAYPHPLLLMVARIALFALMLNGLGHGILSLKL